MIPALLTFATSNPASGMAAAAGLAWITIVAIYTARNKGHR